jgi:general secretion pathway protein G
MFGSLKDKKGFTLLELMIVIAIIGILASLAQPMFKTAVLKSKEAALREDLFNLRNVIDQYYADTGKYPDALQDLVTKGYMRGIPADPFTGSNESWETVPFTGEQDSTSEEDVGGIYDVHSSNEAVGLNGKPYNEW